MMILLPKLFIENIIKIIQNDLDDFSLFLL